MSRFHTEPALAYTAQNRTVVLLLDLGTPDAPTTAVVKPCLEEFLSDQCVVELPKFLWQPILRGLVLIFRPKKDAHAYEKVRFKEGSPLEVYTHRQAEALAKHLPDVIARHTMTYGNLSVADVLTELRAQGVSKLLVIPLYPQYAGSSTDAALDKVFQELLLQYNQMSVRTISRYYDDVAYIQAMKQHTEAYWAQNGRGEKLILNFHGIPQKHYDDGDSYPDECHHTIKLLTQAPGLSEQEHTASFQSRFGKSQWAKPSTQALLDEFPKQGTTKPDVFRPGFIANCLETMEEIAIMRRERLHAAGSKGYRYIPCLNDSADQIAALAQLSRANLQDWI